MGLAITVPALWLASMNLPLPPDAGLDRSWQVALADAFVQARQFGADIVFTYGPWGFLALDGFMPDSLDAKLVWEVFGRLALTLTLVALSGSLRGPRRWVFLGAMILAACFFESVALGMVGLFGLAWLLPADARLWQRALAVGWLGWLAHFKFVLCVEAVAVVGVAVAVHFAERRHRRALGILAGFGAVYVAGWLAAGQQLANLPRFWHLSWEVSSGYSWAMAAEPQPLVLAVGLIVLAWAGALLLLIWRSGGTRYHRLGAALIVALVWLLAWKQGYTRADQHTVGFFVATLLFGLAVPGIAPANRRLCWQDLGTLLCLGGAATAGWDTIMVGPRSARHHWQYYPAAVANLGEWKRQFVDGFRAASERLTDPALRSAVGRGTVDLLNYEQGILFLNGLNYHPRPVIQSYSAYTSALARADGRFFGSERAPDFVVVRLNTIDGRHAGQDDSLALLELVRRYRTVEINSDFVLVRRDRERRVEPEPRRVLLAQHVPHAGDEIAIPDGDGHPIWVEIDFRPTLLGRLRALLYHMAMPIMHVRLSDGGELGFRIVPTTSSDGFFLRPLLHEQHDFSQLVRGRGSRWTQSIRLSADGPRAHWFWRRPRVRFYALTDLPYEHVSPLQTFLDAGAVNVLPVAAHSDTALDALHVAGHQLVFAHAPSRIVLPVNAGGTRLSGVFGFMEGAYAAGATDGADFNIEAVLADGTALRLSSRTLEPVSRPTDRGFQRFTTAIPSGATQVILRIEPGRNQSANWDWTAWGDLRLTR